MEIEKRILVVEDDARSASFLKEALEIYGYKVAVADNGKSGFELFQAEPFPLVISDLEMPFMGGKELIAKLNELEFPPIIIVQTAHHETAIVIDIMRLGIYDYLIKPIQVNELVLKVTRAFETYRLKRMQAALEKERIIRMEDELNWFKWIEENAGRSSSNERSREQTLFYNLKSSIVQGAGFGVLVSLIDFISKSAKKEGNQYLISTELMEEVFKNNLVAKNIIKSFAEINKILNDEIKLNPLTLDKIYEFVKTETVGLNKYSSIKNQTILIDQSKSRFSNFKMYANLDFFKKLIDELLLNAMKFSPLESKITILLNIEEEKNLVIQVMNPAVEDNKKRIGIPMEYENLVFEPFYRMNQFLTSGYDTLDIGIGLTMIKYILKKHNGEAAIYNIRDHRDFSGSKFQVNAKIKLPIIL